MKRSGNQRKLLVRFAFDGYLGPSGREDVWAMLLAQGTGDAAISLDISTWRSRCNHAPHRQSGFCPTADGLPTRLRLHT
jgi:hypothetical protein